MTKPHSDISPTIVKLELDLQTLLSTTLPCLQSLLIAGALAKGIAATSLAMSVRPSIVREQLRHCSESFTTQRRLFSLTLIVHGKLITRLEETNISIYGDAFWP